MWTTAGLPNLLVGQLLPFKPLNKMSLCMGLFLNEEMTNLTIVLLCLGEDQLYCTIVLDCYTSSLVTA